MEKNLSKVALGSAIYAIIALEVAKNIKSLQINSFILFGIYGIIGLMLPTLFGVKKQKNIKLSKNGNHFVLLFGFSISVFINTAIYYIYRNNYYIFENKSFLNRFDLSIAITAPCYVLFIIVLWIFCDRVLYKRLIKENSEIVVVPIVSLVYAILLDNEYVLISVIFGFIAFLLAFLFSNSRISLYILFMKEILSQLFIFVYKYYEVYNLMHYFVFVLMIIAFFSFLAALDNLEDLVFYKQVQVINFAKIRPRDLKLLWFLVILIGYLFVLNI